MTDPDTSISEPLPETDLITQPVGPIRRFFRDAESAGNLEDGMEFHAAGVVIDSDEDSNDRVTVLYLNPFTAKVELNRRELSSIFMYEFPQDDGVYWRLWEQTLAKLERLRAEQ